MTTTAQSAPLAAATGAYDPTGFHDEAHDAHGRPRPEYARLLAELAEVDLGSLASRIAGQAADRGVTFRLDGQPRRFQIDPVPRLVQAAEWAWLRSGLKQRKRALDAFIADVYGQQDIVRAGVVPARAVDGAEHFEPWMTGVEVAGGHAPVAGFDVVRGADGKLRVLEDNLRTPSGVAYAVAARRVVDAHLPPGAQQPKLPLDPCFDALADALRAAAPDGAGDPSVALLSDGPSNGAWYEHQTVARRLGIPIVRPSQLCQRSGGVHITLPSGRLREVQVLYRRTDEDRLRDEHGQPTWLSELLLEPVRNGRLSVVNAFGTGVADDKLLHAYVEDMVRFYLGEEPLVESVRTYDLGEAHCRTRVLGRLGAMVVKPRAGYGGQGIVIGPHASPQERELAARQVRVEPDRFVAQETVKLSRHPTVCEGRLEPRHVDLRVFAIGSGSGTALSPAALTRVALDRGSLVVNTSAAGGGKDTWVLT
ncbi:MAG: hypothetical protein QOK25_1230 [Thermoleophilaceae bacterium]|nr:hypothetical protein [Thermoleophilaceae bacterium]